MARLKGIEVVLTHKGWPCRVKYNGDTYDIVYNRPRKGDLLQALCSGWVTTIGGFYEVIGIDESGLPLVYDDDDSVEPIYYRFSERSAIFRKVGDDENYPTEDIEDVDESDSITFVIKTKTGEIFRVQADEDIVTANAFIKKYTGTLAGKYLTIAHPDVWVPVNNIASISIRKGAN